MIAFTITSTLCHVTLPRTDAGLTNQELQLLKDNVGQLLKGNLGLDERSKTDVEVDICWQHKDQANLKKLSNEQLTKICNLCGQTFSKRRKTNL